MARGQGGFHPATQELIADSLVVAAVNAADIAARDRVNDNPVKVDWMTAFISAGIGLGLEAVGHWGREPAAHEVGDGFILGAVSIAARRAMAQLDANLMKSGSGTGTGGSGSGGSGSGSSGSGTGGSGSSGSSGTSGSGAAGSGTSNTAVTVGAGDGFTVG